MSAHECIKLLQEWADEAFQARDYVRLNALMIDILVLNRAIRSEN